MFTSGVVSPALPLLLDSLDPIIDILGRLKLGSCEYGDTTGATTSSGSLT